MLTQPLGVSVRYRPDAGSSRTVRSTADLERWFSRTNIYQSSKRGRQPVNAYRYEYQDTHRSLSLNNITYVEFYDEASVVVK